MTTLHPSVSNGTSVSLARPSTSGTDERPHFLSEADCRDIIQRLQRFSSESGYTLLDVHSIWTGSVRWARNQIVSGGDDLNHIIGFTHRVRGAYSGAIGINDPSDAVLQQAMRRAERLLQSEKEQPQTELISRLRPEPVPPGPNLFSDATYQLDADRRADAARQLMRSAADAGMLSAGYVEVSAHSIAMLDSLGHIRYFPYTHARYSVTVRDPKGSGSGWAGLDGHDWSRIDGEKLSALALKKCLESRNPVRVEPGRYTVILEPQAVGDFVGRLMQADQLWSKSYNESFDGSLSDKPVFCKIPAVRGGLGIPSKAGVSMIGEKVIDERITISADPMDPAMGFPPFGRRGETDGSEAWFEGGVYRPTTWIERGVLKNLCYGRQYGIRVLGVDASVSNSGAFRMSGGTTSIEEMISTTERGLLVTRFDGLVVVHGPSQLYRGYTRDGLWLIEHGKISKPAKNLVFTESILFALNKIDQLGVPERVFHPPIIHRLFHDVPAPIVAPPLKINDFSFTALSDAV